MSGRQRFKCRRCTSTPGKPFRKFRPLPADFHCDFQTNHCVLFRRKAARTSAGDRPGRRDHQPGSGRALPARGTHLHAGQHLCGDVYVSIQACSGAVHARDAEDPGSPQRDARRRREPLPETGPSRVVGDEPRPTEGHCAREVRGRQREYAPLRKRAVSR